MNLNTSNRGYELSPSEIQNYDRRERNRIVEVVVEGATRMNEIEAGGNLIPESCAYLISQMNEDIRPKTKTGNDLIMAKIMQKHQGTIEKWFEMGSRLEEVDPSQLQAAIADYRKLLEDLEKEFGLTEQIQGAYKARQDVLRLLKNDFDQVRRRASKAPQKVRERVEDRFMPDLENGDSMEHHRREYRRIENDFVLLRDDPSHEVGGGNYEGWTSGDIEELYYVLYGEKL